MAKNKQTKEQTCYDNMNQNPLLKRIRLKYLMHIGHPHQNSPNQNH